MSRSGTFEKLGIFTRKKNWGQLETSLNYITLDTLTTKYSYSSSKLIFCDINVGMMMMMMGQEWENVSNITYRKKINTCLGPNLTLT